MKIVILTGAGVSAESGLGTFRDEGGLWSEYDLEEVATPEGFARDPSKVHAFYNARRANAAEARPNDAHVALAELQQDHSGDVILITQNVDRLHEDAGAEDVLHMHGRLDRAKCTNCRHQMDAPDELFADTPCPNCGQPTLRPDIVWFGEIPEHMDEIAAHLSEADVFVAIGTSGQVYPAAGFVAEAASHGAETIELNLEASDVSALFNDIRLGPASEIVPAWVAEVLDR